MGYGVIGSPTDSGSVSLGSSPGTPALIARGTAPSSRGPGRRPLKAVAPVRIRSGLQPWKPPVRRRRTRGFPLCWLRAPTGCRAAFGGPAAAGPALGSQRDRVRGSWAAAGCRTRRGGEPGARRRCRPEAVAERVRGGGLGSDAVGVPGPTRWGAGCQAAVPARGGGRKGARRRPRIRGGGCAGPDAVGSRAAGDGCPGRGSGRKGARRRPRIRRGGVPVPGGGPGSEAVPVPGPTRRGAGRQAMGAQAEAVAERVPGGGAGPEAVGVPGPTRWGA
jgi:hypothetical protein